MTYPYFSVRNLQCTRNNRVLFLGITFSLNEGDIMHLRGENGIGKTTLLRTLAGLSRPYAGDILFLGEKIAQTDHFKINLHYLGHKIALKDSLTVSENLHYSLSNPVMEDQIDDMLDRVGLLKKKDSITGNLSAGQKQRLALARLALSKTKLWILDEPFSSLDSDGVKIAQMLIKEHSNKRGIVIFTSHQMLPEAFERQVNMDLLPCLEIVEWPF